MMFTICILMYGSLMSQYPISTECKEKASFGELRKVAAMCEMADKDPLTTCEMVEVADHRWAVYLRKLEVG